MKKNPFNNIFSLLKLKTPDGEKPTKLAYVVLVGLLGLLILLVGDFFTSDEAGSEGVSPPVQTESVQPNEQETFGQKKDEADMLMSEVETYYEKELKELLEKIQGVSEVEVMVNLDSTEAKVYEKNTTVSKQHTTETDKSGGERKIEDFTEDEQIVVTRQGDQEAPLLIRTDKPSVRGVGVVAKGADHMKVKEWIVETVSRTLDVPTHRISVMPKK
ncbi:stage III sporulation protein AG [Pontibacillus salipaludis]|uniref:stage III sporulation protein AG n=1 Tax=Pontibacillus salipaludis TaxID=1697394 RepID=UPI0031EA291C